MKLPTMSDLFDAFTHMEEAHWEYLDAGYRHVLFHDFFLQTMRVI